MRVFFFLSSDAENPNLAPSRVKNWQFEKSRQTALNHRSLLFLKAKERVPNQHTRKSIEIRDMRDSNKACLFANIDWSCIANQPTCEEKILVFRKLVQTGMSNMPERSIKVYLKDAPWMSVRLKELIRLASTPFIQTDTVWRTCFTVTLLTKKGNDIKRCITLRRCTIFKE